MTSWIDIEPESPFSLENIPFGIISTEGNVEPRPATIIGNTVVDLKAFSQLGGFEDVAELDSKVFLRQTLNNFAASGRRCHVAVRTYLKQVFTANGPFASILEENPENRKSVLLNRYDSGLKHHVPMAIGDYTDFYVGRNHAYNCGVLFRGPENALNPNYYHLPVGYHGRASSIVVSGTEIHRPCGQIIEATPGQTNYSTPVFSESKKLDFELELAAFISKPNNLGERIPVDEAEEHIFGYVLMNDWSARDIQAWEYVPLGPFTAKNFGTSISPWVVLHDALIPYRALPLERPESAPRVIEYLEESNQNSVFDLDLSIELSLGDGSDAEGETTAVISRGSSKNMLYSFQQMLAHHTVTGCNMRTGDLIASGTISGDGSSSLGSLLEMTSGGKREIKVGSKYRTFLQDGDRVTICGQGAGGQSGQRVGFGEVSGRVIGVKQ